MHKKNYCERKWIKKALKVKFDKLKNNYSKKKIILNIITDEIYIDEFIESLLQKIGLWEKQKWEKLLKCGTIELWWKLDKYYKEWNGIHAFFVVGKIEREKTQDLCMLKETKMHL